MNPGNVAYYTHRPRKWKAKGYDLCVLTCSPVWQGLVPSSTLPPNGSNTADACKAHGVKAPSTKWIVTICLQVFKGHHKPNQSFILLINVFHSPIVDVICCLWLRDIELELHGAGSPGSKLSPVGSTA